MIPSRPLTPFYVFAKRLLSVCANSASCERLFSVFGTTLTKLRNRMGTSTLSSLAELKMHVRGEHQEKSTKIRMKHLFNHRSSTTPAGTTSTSQPPPPDPNPESAITSSTSPTSETSTSGLRHLIPDDTVDDDPNYRGTTSPVSLADLFDFEDIRWVSRYNGYAQNHLSEELELCELLNRDSATEEGAEVDVDEMTSEILMG